MNGSILTPEVERQLQAEFIAINGLTICPTFGNDEDTLRESQIEWWKYRSDRKHKYLHAGHWRKFPPGDRR